MDLIMLKCYLCLSGVAVTTPWTKDDCAPSVSIETAVSNTSMWYPCLIKVHGQMHARAIVHITQLIKMHTS